MSLEKKWSISNRLMVLVFCLILGSGTLHAQNQASASWIDSCMMTDLSTILTYPELAHAKTPLKTSLSQGTCKLDSAMGSDSEHEPKSRGRAFLYSFMVPGAGEYYLGNKTLAKTFFFTEVLLWAGYFSFEAYGDWKRDDMYTMAATHANSIIRDRPAQYYVDLGNFQDIYQYNDAKERQREFYKIYDVDDFYWSWDSDANRRAFEKLRISSDRAHNRAVFVVGAIIANHVVSAVDAVWQSSRLSKSAQRGPHNKYTLHFSTLPLETIRVTLLTSF